jgi:hypothetical protein
MNGALYFIMDDDFYLLRGLWPFCGARADGRHWVQHRDGLRPDRCIGDRAILAVPRRIGLAPDGGAIWFLTNRIGMARAKELGFTGRFVEAAEALSLGLVNEVVADGELMPRAEALAAELAEGPTFAFGLAKKMFNVANRIAPVRCPDRQRHRQVHRFRLTRPWHGWWEPWPRCWMRKETLFGMHE